MDEKNSGGGFEQYRAEYEKEKRRFLDEPSTMWPNEGNSYWGRTREMDGEVFMSFEDWLAQKGYKNKDRW